MREGETVVHKTFGSFLDRGWISPVWRPGFLYLTDERLFLFRKEPEPKILVEVPIHDLESLMMVERKRIKKNGKELYLQYDCDEIVRVHASDVEELKEEIEKVAERELEQEISIVDHRDQSFEDEKIIMEEKLWYLLPPSGILSDTWKPGRLYLTDKRLSWVYKMDNQKMFEVPLDKVIGVSIKFDGSEEKVLVIEYDGGEAFFGGNFQRLENVRREIDQKVLQVLTA